MYSPHKGCAGLPQAVPAGHAAALAPTVAAAPARTTAAVVAQVASPLCVCARADQCVCASVCACVRVRVRAHAALCVTARFRARNVRSACNALLQCVLDALSPVPMDSVCIMRPLHLYCMQLNESVLPASPSRLCLHACTHTYTHTHTLCTPIIKV